MIVISAGMQKAGTGWFFNMTNDLLVAAGYDDVREIKERYRLQRILKYQNCNIGRLLGVKFVPQFIPMLGGKTYVVKTHSNPTFALRGLTKLDLTKSLYIYRDPRDAAVSAFEHGVKLRAEGQSHSFARLTTLEMAIQAAYEWSEIWDQWSKFPQTLMVKYENLLVNTCLELGRCVDFLDFEISEEHIQRIVKKYEKNSLDPNATNNLHFNQGVTGRYASIMDDVHISSMNEKLSGVLTRMGYSHE